MTMTSLFVQLITFIFSVSVVFAAPVVNEPRDSISIASTSTVNSLTPYAKFARAAYCMSSAETWTCGAACNDIPDFVMYAGGGDGAATPHWFVGWSPSMSSIVVVHEGTDPTQFLSVLNDIDFLQDPLDQSYFPGISSSFYVHGGFQDTFKSSAKSILAAVKNIMSARNTSKVTVIGHSLGGAIALLDTVYLGIQIPSLKIKTVTLGVPRVGNAAFADYMGRFDLTRITHKQDPIPIVPGRALGFHHPQGEIHQGTLTGLWYQCNGEDVDSVFCSTGEVDNIFVGNIIDHLGSYNGVWVGTIYC